METSKTLTGQQSNDLTLFAVDTLANHLAPQASGKAQTTHDIYGLGSEMPLAHYDQLTQSWRTSEDISLWGDYKLLENLPKSGMTLNGVLFQQQEWVRPIDETELLLWPTPLTNDNKAGLKKANPNLIDAVLIRPNLGDPAPTTQEFKQDRMWPTARASAAMADSPEAILRNLKKKGYKSKLEQAVQLWPTPRAAQAEARNHTVYSREFGKPQNLENRIAQRDPSAIGGKLNPMWVEWLMGFPIGWTDLED